MAAASSSALLPRSCRGPAWFDRPRSRADEPDRRRRARARPRQAASLGPLKQIDAGLLNVGYAESGPANGPVVILLHGWPYDIDSFAEVVPLLAAAGYRVIVPYLRGYGTTRFLSDASVPQRSAFGASPSTSSR